MTRDEHKRILRFVEQATCPATRPATASPEPMDVEADAIIRALFVRNPEAAYRITILAMDQASELDRIKAELDESRRSFRGNWLARLLKKQTTLSRQPRRDPKMAIFPQNIRGR